MTNPYHQLISFYCTMTTHHYINDINWNTTENTKVNHFKK